MDRDPLCSGAGRGGRARLWEGHPSGASVWGPWLCAAPAACLGVGGVLVSWFAPAAALSPRPGTAPVGWARGAIHVFCCCCCTPRHAWALLAWSCVCCARVALGPLACGSGLQGEDASLPTCRPTGKANAPRETCRRAAQQCEAQVEFDQGRAHIPAIEEQRECRRKRLRSTLDRPTPETQARGAQATGYRLPGWGVGARRRRGEEEARFQAAQRGGKQQAKNKAQHARRQVGPPREKHLCDTRVRRSSSSIEMQSSPPRLPLHLLTHGPLTGLKALRPR